MSVTFLISFQAKPAFSQAFADLMASVKNDLPTVSGCRGIRILKEADVADSYTLVEIWESKEAHQKNSQELADSGAWDAIVEMLDGAPDGRYFEAI